MDRRDQIEDAQRGERHGVAHLIADPQRRRLLLLLRQPDHRRRDVDAPLLELPGVETEAAGQIKDALPGECPHHAEDRIALGPFQRGCLRIHVVLAVDVIILRWVLRHGCLCGRRWASAGPPGPLLARTGGAGTP